MKLKTRFFAVTAFCFMLFHGLHAQDKSQSIIQGHGWTMSIVEASLRDSITSWDNMATPANQKWLVLELELNASQPPSFIPAKQIRIVDDEKETYSLIAVADKAIPMFMNFNKQSAFFRDAQDKVTLLVGKDEKTNEVGMQIQAQKVSEVLLAFAVPSNSRNLYLQVGDAPRIRITPRAQ